MGARSFFGTAILYRAGAGGDGDRKDGVGRGDRKDGVGLEVNGTIPRKTSAAEEFLHVPVITSRV